MEEFYIRRVVSKYVRTNTKVSPGHLRGSKGLSELARKIIPDGPQEHFLTVGTSNQNEVLATKVSGGLDTVILDPREIFGWALRCGVVSMAFAHNHPSGNVQPSKQDIALTKQFLKIGKILQIRILDHVIIGVNSNNDFIYYSFLDAGELK